MVMKKNEVTSQYKKVDEKKIKSYAITAAQGIQNPASAAQYGSNFLAGAPNKPLIKNIERYVDINDAELHICSIAGANINEIDLHEFFWERDDVSIHSKARKRNEQHRQTERIKRREWEEAKARAEDKGYSFNKKYPLHYFWEEIPTVRYPLTGKTLNSNLALVGTQTPPQNKDPLTGKQTLLKKFNGKSIIFPATKQRLKTFASGQSGEYPKIIMTTGACTHPNYHDTNMRGEEAEDMHKYGFAVVDILSDKIYLPRIVPAQKNGTFVDLGIKYTLGKPPEKVETTAMVVGDSHVAQINPKVEKANREMVEWFEPRAIHLNDVFDALSINLHNLKDSLLIDFLHERGLDILENEAILTAQYLYDYGKIAEKFGGTVEVNFSNHDDMLYRWITGQEWVDDRTNRQFVYKLLPLKLERDDTFEKMIRLVRPDLPKNVNFLKRGEDRIYWGYQCAAHGHLGKNGARGNLKNLMEGFTKVIKGHSHDFEINDDSIGVGTSSMIPMPYQLGQPSTSMAANAVVYKGGLAQGIPIIKGRWSKEGFSDFLKK
ncbi:hypothetical protein B6U91_01025 [Candidatus Pacearchaeota archaeon ex4484_71]|nr:MAG: hypothetical protein B6U91_01025 [Candidatus Pacearchaeota archaeon ex4484_71]